MMGMDGLLMLAAMLICLLAVSLLVIGAAWVGVRATRSTRHVDRGREGRAMLDRRLAGGEISVEEYYERESALRSADPPPERRSWWR